MKIGVVMPLAEQRGGAEQMLLHLLRASCRLPGAPEYHLAFLENGPMAQEAADLGYPVRVFCAGKLRQAPRFAATVGALKHWMRCENVEGVMSWMGKAHLYAGPAARQARLPAVWWQHALPAGNALDRLTTRLPARAIFCCSETARDAQARIAPRRPLHVINPAVDLERFDPDRLPPVADARRLLGLGAADVPVVGIVTRLQRWKGVSVFVHAVARLAPTRPDARFVVVGGVHALEPDYAGALAQEVHDLGLSERVLLAGYQPDTALWMQAMDVVAHASLQPEPFGMVLIEAMALGKSVVAARAGGPCEIVDENVDGRLFTPGDAAALANSIEQSLANSAANRAMRAAARQKAAAYGTERLAAQVARHLREVMQA